MKYFYTCKKTTIINHTSLLIRFQSRVGQLLKKTKRVITKNHLLNDYKIKKTKFFLLEKRKTKKFVEWKRVDLARYVRMTPNGCKLKILILI